MIAFVIGRTNDYPSRETYRGEQDIPDLDRVGLSRVIFELSKTTRIIGSSTLNLNRDVSFSPADASEAAKRDAQTGTLTIRRPGSGTIEISPVTLTADALLQIGITVPEAPVTLPEAVVVYPVDVSLVALAVLARALGASLSIDADGSGVVVVTARAGDQIVRSKRLAVDAAAAARAFGLVR
jgi:hypothetical protein